jgi:hypothetical protein
MRYYNPRAIIAKLFKEFYGITPTARESAVDMRRFTDEVLRIHRAFKNLNVPIESWDVAWDASLSPDMLRRWRD